MLQKEIHVALGPRSYPVYIGSGMLASFISVCERHGIPGDMVIITDRTVGRWYQKPLEERLQQAGRSVISIVVPPGEEQKSLATAGKIFTRMLSKGIGRSSAVIALGGGVIGDLAGFVAATYHRGIPLIQFPTTLLSQVDSSVGGKTAVNHRLGKNMIGAFHQPVFVWTDVDVLKTLPFREILCGMGEIIKYGVILDADLFEYLERNLDRALSLEREAVLHIQHRCCSLKAALVSEDERERGRRIVLNYGHTVGHALEAAGNYRILKHGEAVLLGMIAESLLARDLGLLSPHIHERIMDLIMRLPLSFRKGGLKLPAIMQAMGRDKKSMGGTKRFVFPVRIGETTVVEAVPSDRIHDAVRQVLKLRFPVNRQILS